MKFYGTLAVLTAMVLSLSAVTVDPGKAVIVVKKMLTASSSLPEENCRNICTRSPVKRSPLSTM